MSAKKKISSSKSVAIGLGIGAAIIVLVSTTAVFGGRAYAASYEGRIFPGVRIFGTPLDGLTPEQADQKIHRVLDERLAQGLKFVFRGQEKRIDVTSLSTTDPDATHDLIQYNIDDAVAEALRVGRGYGWNTNILVPLRARIRPVTIPVGMTLDVPGFETALRQAFRGQLIAAKDASFSFRAATGSLPTVVITSEEAGVDVSVEKAMDQLRRQAEVLEFQPIVLQEVHQAPTLRRQDLESLQSEAQAFVSRPALTFTYQDRVFPIPTSTMLEWMTIVKQGKKLTLTLDPTAVSKTFHELAPDLEKDATNGSLVVKDGHIESFVAGSQGSKMRVDETLKAVTAEWPAKTTFPLVVEVTSGTLLGEDPARLGIKEIIGVGRSNFAGSPVNRRKNIQLGIKRVNGTLIAPGEEFSLLKTLGPIDGEHGWLPELVIKGDKTLPEFGGGLCQIGTTTFRGALDSGLKITQRHNHSYRVRYYEPAGTDATIYEPSPDFRFVNDTAQYVLINAHAEGDDIFFEFWGNKDGRHVEPIKPRVFNITAPPPTKLIETMDLPVGQKKCTETAHAGADAEFTYKITYADGTLHEEVFKSHYRPWQAVCLIGVEKLSAPTVPTTTQTQ